MLYALATGTLIADPITRTSGGSGKEYLTATLRTPIEREEAVLVSVAAFDDEAKAALSELRKGDAVSIKGQLKPTTWTGRDGGVRSGLSMVALRVLTGKPEPRKRKPKEQVQTAPAAGAEFPPEAGDLSAIGRERNARA